MALRYNPHLHSMIIDFITSENRLFKMEWSDTWMEFFVEFPRYEFHYTVKSIREMFFNQILPHIFDCELTEVQRNYFRLLDNYPGLVRTPTGYKLRPNVEDCNKAIAQNMDQVMAEVEDAPGVVALMESRDYATVKDEVSADPELQAWLSAFVGTEEERNNQMLLSYEEIRTRLPRFLENCRDIEAPFQWSQFLEKLKRDHESKKQVMEKVNQLLERKGCRRRQRGGR